MSNNTIFYDFVPATGFWVTGKCTVVVGFLVTGAGCACATGAWVDVVCELPVCVAPLALFWWFAPLLWWLLPLVLQVMRGQQSG